MLSMEDDEVCVNYGHCNNYYYNYGELRRMESYASYMVQDDIHHLDGV
jgi:hypothetical protein